MSKTKRRFLLLNVTTGVPLLLWTIYRAAATGHAEDAWFFGVVTGVYVLTLLWFWRRNEQ